MVLSGDLQNIIVTLEFPFIVPLSIPKKMFCFRIGICFKNSVCKLFYGLISIAMQVTSKENLLLIYKLFYAVIVLTLSYILKLEASGLYNV